ncbi:MAG TPA: hypothetical protein VGM21_02500 [Actinomycetota bacterium]|jgi:hypothetical protein
MHGNDAGRPPTRPRQDAEPDFELWVHLGAESVFFYPPGSLEEHLVVDHGIPSIDLHWQVKGEYHDHQGDHRKQWRARMGTIGELLAVTHAHTRAA